MGVVFQVTAKLINLPDGAPPLNSPMNSQIWASRSIIDNAIVDSVNDRRTASDAVRTVHKIWPSLDESRTMGLLKHQTGTLIAVVAKHCILNTRARRIDLERPANDFCRSSREEKEDETVPHLLSTNPALF